MKFKFLNFFSILCYLCTFILPSFATTKIVANAPIWRSSIYEKSQYLVITGQDNEFIMTLFIFSARQSVLQLSYSSSSNIPKDTTTLNFTLGKQIFTLRKQVTNTRNSQTNFETLLTPQQLQSFIHDFTSKEKVYITINHNVIPMSLMGTSSIVSTLLQHLEKEPMPKLPAPFGKLDASSQMPWFNFSITHNQLLYSMGAIVFLLLFGRPILKFLAYIYRRRKNSYYTNKALKIAIYQMKQNANILYIKRDQLLYKDDYGTLIEDKWIQEVNRFIKTKIKPLLAERQLLIFYPFIQKIIFKKILYIAQYPPKKEKIVFKKRKKEKIQYSPTMDPLDYEAYCAELLRKKGWNAEVTTASGDQGADVIAIKKGITLIIQCKLYSKPVGNKAIQEVHAAKVYYHAHYVAVVSNASYTTSARQLAASTQVALLHHETLQKFAYSLI